MEKLMGCQIQETSGMLKG